jgi:hypothetical protein
MLGVDVQDSSGVEVPFGAYRVSQTCSENNLAAASWICTAIAKSGETHLLRNTQLAVPHQALCKLLHNRVVPSLKVRCPWQRHIWETKLVAQPSTGVFKAREKTYLGA